MTPLIENQADIIRLREIAQSWLVPHTPYAPDGAVKGAGCSCHRLPYEILKEFGFEVEEAPKRGGTPKRQIEKLMQDWLDSHAEFERVEFLELSRPGDVVLINAGFGHLALMLEEKNLIHSWQHDGVHVVSAETEKIRQNIKGIWRPLKK